MSTTSSCTPSIVEYSCSTPAILTSVGGEAGHRGQQDAAQRVAERVAVAALERLHRHLGVERREVLHVDDAGLQEIVALLCMRGTSAIG